MFSLAGTDTPQALYHVIPEKKVERIGSQMMASTHVYDLSVRLIQGLLRCCHECE